MMTVTLTAKYLSNHYHVPINPQNLLQMVAKDGKEGYMVLNQNEKNTRKRQMQMPSRHGNT